MNWAVHPALYQLTHWWHWLTYGQNTAALALIGLVFYTYYTKRMMKAAEETRRLSLTPYLVADVRPDLMRIWVTNVGAPAVRCEFWTQPVSAAFKLGGLRLIRPLKTNRQYIPTILAGKPIEVTVERILGFENILYVLDCHDTAGGKYQLQLLQDKEGQIENSFRVPEALYPLHKFALNRVKQLWELANSALRKN